MKNDSEQKWSDRLMLLNIYYIYDMFFFFNVAIKLIYP